MQETTSRQGSQSLELRAKQHLFLFALATEELGLRLYDENLATECHLEDIAQSSAALQQVKRCVDQKGVRWALDDEIEQCVAGRKNCKLRHPGDVVVKADSDEVAKPATPVKEKNSNDDDADTALSRANLIEKLKEGVGTNLPTEKS